MTAHLPTPEESLRVGDFRMAALAIVYAAHPLPIGETDVILKIHEALPKDYRGEDPIDASLDALIELTVGGMLMWDLPVAEERTLIYRVRTCRGGDDGGVPTDNSRDDEDDQ